MAPLLPGSIRSLVLITSRRNLGDIPSAVPVPLDVLTPDEAIAMFVGLAPRAATDRDTVAEVLRVCGYLPLAISVLASVFLRHRSWTVDDLLQEIHHSDDGSLSLTAESRSVAAVFELSYQHLHADRARLFRLLSLHPGVDIDPYAAAALAGTSLKQAWQHLDGLHEDHLLEEPVYRRYRMHDLIRTYAHKQATTTDTAQTKYDAIGRLLDFYRHTAAIAMDLAYPYERQCRPSVASAGTPIPVLADPHQAERWLDSELTNLLAAAHHGAGDDRPEHTWHLSAILDRHLRTRGRHRDALTLHQYAVDLADQVGNQAAQTRALNGLGYVAWMVGHYAQAGDHYRRALNIARTSGDRRGELNSLTGLGHVHRGLGDYEHAGDHYRRGLRIAQAIGDRGGEKSALQGLGHTNLRLGHSKRAGDYHRQALRIAQAIGDRGGELDALNGLGYVYWTLGRYERAGDHFEQALHIAQAIGDRRGETNALNGLGHVHWLLDRHDKAGGYHRQALQIAQAIGDRRGEMNALNGFGDVHRRLGRIQQAGDHYRQALQIAQAIGDRGGEINALDGTGYVHLITGRFEQAGDQHRSALQIAHAIGDRAPN